MVTVGKGLLMSSTTQIPKHEVAQGDGEQEQVASFSSSDRIRFLIGFFFVASCGLSRFIQ